MGESLGKLCQSHFTVLAQNAAGFLHRQHHLDLFTQAHHVARFVDGKRKTLHATNIITELLDKTGILRRQLAPGLLQTLEVAVDVRSLTIMLKAHKAFRVDNLDPFQSTDLMPQFVQVAIGLCAAEPVDAAVDVVALPVPAGALTAGKAVLFEYHTLKSVFLGIDAGAQACNPAANYGDCFDCFFHCSLLCVLVLRACTSSPAVCISSCSWSISAAHDGI